MRYGEKTTSRLRGQRKFTPSFLRNAPFPASSQPLRRCPRPDISILLCESRPKASPIRVQRHASGLKRTDSTVSPALGVGWELTPLLTSPKQPFPMHTDLSRASSRLSQARLSIRNVHFQDFIESALGRYSSIQAVHSSPTDSPNGSTPNCCRSTRKLVLDRSSPASTEPVQKPSSLPPRLFQNASLRALAKCTNATSSKRQ